MLPALTRASSISDFSPVSHWTCDESSGIRYDSNDAKNNDLTDNNTVGTSTGLRGNACNFQSANSEYLSITSASSTGLEANSFTISFWGKQTTKTTFAVTKKYTTSGTALSWVSGFNADVTQYAYAYTGNGTNINELTSGAPSLSTGTWYHIVTTWDNTAKQIKTYVNGALAGSLTGSYNIAYNSGTLFIGQSGYGSYFNGDIDEITYFDTVLSAGNVDTLYNSGTPLPYTATTSSSTSSTSTTTNFFEGQDVVSFAILWTLSFLLAIMIWRQLS